MPVVDNKYETCDANDPLRCQGVVSGSTRGGQCPFKSVENSRFCPMHGGTPQIDVNKKLEVARYRLTKYQSRVGDFANDSEIKNLREEIGILRMTLESMLNVCDNANKLLMYSDHIGKLVGQINGLICSAQKLEERNNNLLDRKVVIVIADAIVTIVGDYISDPDQLAEVGTKICESITNAASPTYNPRVVTQGDNAA